jgi:hypothetical protein
MTATLWDVARQAQDQGQQLEARVTKGGFGNGRSEAHVSVGGIINGQVVVQQGLVADWIFVSPQSARAVEVEMA